MTNPSILSALAAAALTSTACAQSPAIPFRFEFSPVRVERVEHNAPYRYGGHDYRRNDYRHDRYERYGHRDHGGCSCRCGSRERIKLVAGHQCNKPNRPKGWHTREWFESRGYDLRNYAHKHERSGKVHYGSRMRRR